MVPVRQPVIFFQPTHQSFVINARLCVHVPATPTAQDGKRMLIGLRVGRMQSLSGAAIPSTAPAGERL